MKQCLQQHLKKKQLTISKLKKQGLFFWMALIGIWDKSLHIWMFNLFNMFFFKLKYWLFIDYYNNNNDLFAAKPVDFRSFCS